MSTLKQLTELPNFRLKGKTAKYQQIYQAIKRSILNGELTENLRLPPSRILAHDLSIARNTVQKAYEQLIGEGYLQSKLGSGIYVCAQIPEHFTEVQITSEKNSLRKTTTLKSTSRIKRPVVNTHLAPGVPDLTSFPNTIWQRLTNNILRSEYKHLLYSDDDLGEQSLRQAIAEYLSYARGVRCQQEQILITSGAQEAINLCLHSLLSANNYLAIEDPGYRGAYNVAQYKKCRIMPIPLEKDGFSIRSLKQQKNHAQVIYITPSHQYPLCMPMPINKRYQLLEYAIEQQSYIIEDDYDSEFHYQNKPIAAMQGLIANDRVIYMGTFSKVLFPALRLGYLVLPEHLLEKFTTVKTLQFGHTALLNQMVTAEFIRKGYFTKHIKKMRLLYAKKYQCIVKACQQHLPSEITLFAHGAGLHISIQFPKSWTIFKEQSFVQELNQNGLYPMGLSNYYHNKNKMGLVLGFGDTEYKKITPSIKILAKLYQQKMLQ